MPQLNQRIRHIEKRTEYVIIALGKVRDLSTPTKWVPSITYYHVKTEAVYTRPSEGFWESFERVPTPNVICTFKVPEDCLERVLSFIGDLNSTLVGFGMGKLNKQGQYDITVEINFQRGGKIYYSEMVLRSSVRDLCVALTHVSSGEVSASWSGTLFGEQ